MTCDCPTDTYTQTAADGTTSRVTETTHRIGCPVGVALLRETA